MQKEIVAFESPPVVGLDPGAGQSSIEHTMKLFSPQIFLVFGAFATGLVACAAAPSPSPIHPRDVVAPGPKGLAATETFAPDVVEVKVELAKNERLPMKPIVQRPDAKDTKESDVDQGQLDSQDSEHARGPTDPLAAFGQITQGGEASDGGLSHGRGGLGVASNAKGARLAGAATGSASGMEMAGTAGGTTIGAATEVRGTIDKAEIQRVVRAHLNDVKHCYDQGLARTPSIEGKVVLNFTIGKTGTVVASVVRESTLNDRAVEQCIAGVARRWTFPKPTGEGVVVISYPFILKSAD